MELLVGKVQQFPKPFKILFYGENFNPPEYQSAFKCI